MRQGFTLLEISIVLAIIGVVLAGGTLLLTASVQTAQYNATVDRIKALDAALLNYRVGFNRLPCPADLTLSPANVNYGEEAGWNSSSTISTATGVCTGSGMTPQANFSAAASATADTVAEGAMPTRALRLPDSYMFDAWGRRFRYAVDVTMTAANAFANTPILPSICSPAGISVTDASDIPGSRTVNGVYAIVSHGADGHGGYTINGVAFSSQSVNADELTNCHCTSTAAAGTYAPAYVQKLLTTDPANALNNFDDLVSFGTLDQMQTQTTTEPVGRCQYLAASSNTSPYIYLYVFVNGNLILMPAPSALPGGSTNRISFTPDNSKIMFNASDNKIYVYNVTSSGLTFAYSPFTMNSGSTLSALSPDGYYFFAPGGYPYGNQALKSNAGTFSTTGINMGTGTTEGGGDTYQYQFGYSPDVEWSTDNSTVYHIAAANSSGYNNLYAYTNTAGSFSLATAVNFNTYSGGAYAGDNTDMSVHPSGSYLALAASGGSVTLFKLPLTPNPTVLITASLGTIPTSIAWSPDGTQLAHIDFSNGLYVASFNSATYTFTADTISGSQCSGGYNSRAKPAWTYDSKYVAMAGENAPTLCLFKQSGTTFTNMNLSNSLMPNGVATATAFSH